MKEAGSCHAGGNPRPSGHAAGGWTVSRVVENESRAREISYIASVLLATRPWHVNAGSRGSLEQMMRPAPDLRSQGVPAGHQGRRAGLDRSHCGALEKLGTDEVRARIVHSGDGAITESDISLAEASNAAIIGFNVRATRRPAMRPNGRASRSATYNIIYDLTDDVKAAMSGLLFAGASRDLPRQCRDLEVLTSRRSARFAGCRVIEGKVERGAACACCATRRHPRRQAQDVKRFKDERGRSADGSGLRYGLRELRRHPCRRRHRMLPRRAHHPHALIGG